MPYPPSTERVGIIVRISLVWHACPFNQVILANKIYSLQLKKSEQSEKVLDFCDIRVTMSMQWAKNLSQSFNKVRLLVRPRQFCQNFFSEK